MLGFIATLPHLVKNLTIERFMITGRQLKAARTLLGLSIESLAEAAKISPMSVRRAEASTQEVNVTPVVADAIERALVERGAVFIAAVPGRHEATAALVADYDERFGKAGETDHGGDDGNLTIKTSGADLREFWLIPPSTPLSDVSVSVLRSGMYDAP
jgi:transcriptional regulator with XRE-family HTH domain